MKISSSFLDKVNSKLLIFITCTIVCLSVLMATGVSVTKNIIIMKNALTTVQSIQQMSDSPQNEDVSEVSEAPSVNRDNIYDSKPEKAHTQEVRATSESEEIFYVTASGTKYHTSDCSYLSKSKITITLSDALEKGYTPCSRCLGK